MNQFTVKTRKTESACGKITGKNLLAPFVQSQWPLVCLSAPHCIIPLIHHLVPVTKQPEPSLLSIFLPGIVVCFQALRQCLQLIRVGLRKCMITEPLHPYLCAQQHHNCITSSGLLVDPVLIPDQTQKVTGINRKCNWQKQL